MSLYKQIIGTVIILALFVGVFFIGRLTGPDNNNYLRDTLYMPVDSSCIISQARAGYTAGTIEELTLRFGKIYLDTNVTDSINFIDSIRFKDSIVFVQKLFSDTIHPYHLTDSITGIAANFDLQVQTTAYFHPVYQIHNNIILGNFTITGIKQKYYWKWYDQFYVGVGYPGFLQIGYGLSLGNIRKLTTFH